MKKLFFIATILVILTVVPGNAFATTTDISSPADGSNINGTPATFSGHTVTNGLIHLQEDGVTIASTTANDSGIWTITTSNIKRGAHDYVAIADFGTRNIAFLATQVDGQIDVVDVDNETFIYEIHLPTNVNSTDHVVSGDSLFVAAYNENTFECSVMEYNIPGFSLVRTITFPQTCVGNTIDVNQSGTMAVVTFIDFGTDNTHISLVRLSDGTITDTFDTGVSLASNALFSPDGTRVYLGNLGGIYAFNVSAVSGTLVSGTQTDYVEDGLSQLAVAPDGTIITGESGTGKIRLINPADLDDSETIQVESADAGFERIAISPDSKTAMVVGINDNNDNYIDEVDLENQSVTHSYTIARTPEAVGYTPSGNKYIVGDNYSSGFIYFGVPGQASAGTPLVNGGARYAMPNTHFTASVPDLDASEIVSTVNAYIDSTFGTDPNATVVAKTVAPGDSVDVSGSGFQANTDVTITLHSTPVVLKTVKANSSGTFSTSVTIPKNTALGSHTLEFSGLNGNGDPESSSLSLLVSQLPATGGDTTQVAYFACALMGAGWIIFRSTRRRKLLFPH